VTTQDRGATTRRDPQRENPTAGHIQPTTTVTSVTPDKNNPPPRAEGTTEAYIILDDNGNPLGYWEIDNRSDEWVFHEYDVPGGRYASLPKTGDDADSRIWFILLLVSTVVLRHLIFFRKKDEDYEGA